MAGANDDSLSPHSQVRKGLLIPVYVQEVEEMFFPVDWFVFSYVEHL